MTARTRKPGDFCWTNMLTPKPSEARAFFGKVLGWTYTELPGVGHLVQVGGRDVGGLFDLDDPKTPKGTPPLIGVMILVENADAAAKRVVSLGGKAMPPFDVFDHGRMAVCTDPNGAEFDVWQPRKMPGTDVDGRAHGAPTWFETLTTDVDRAAAFYSGLFGWKAAVVPRPGPKYTTFQLGELLVGGTMELTREMTPQHPHWATYFCVKSADDAARTADAAGGKVFVPVQVIPGIGRFCGIVSPQGVRFYVIEYAA